MSLLNCRYHSINADVTISCWGYTFELTKDHLSAERAEPLKHSYDRLGEDCLEILDRISPPPRSQLPRNQNEEPRKPPSGVSTPTRDLYILLKEHKDSDPKLSELWNQINTVPPWVDWHQIQRGQDVFYRYGGAALTGLAYQSLLGGMGAARVVETLARTGGFSTKVAKRRLFETTQHILQCTRTLEAIQPDGEGFASSIRVRFLHAAVRRRILKLAAERPDYYSVEKWGVPINDLDSIATIGTFSATLIWLSLPRQGIFLRQQEIADYVALWRYIGYIMGTPDEYFATPHQAKCMMESLLMNEISPTHTSQILATNIIKSLQDQPPSYASADMLVASARWLNGNELSDSLGLPRPSFYYSILMAGQCMFFIFVCYIYRAVPVLDRRKIATLKRVFYAIIVESKYGLQGTETLFDFKYVPEFTTVTDIDEGTDVKVRERGIEWRNLKWFMIGVASMGVVSWCSVKVTSMAVRGAIGLFWR